MEHLRQHLDQQLAEIYSDLEQMGAEVQGMLTHTCGLLKKYSRTAAESIIKKDEDIDNLEMIIDDKCLSLIATEQPVASDLRKIISVTKVTSDLERIADIARYIAKKFRVEISERFGEYIPSIIEMFELGIRMLQQAVDSFMRDDEERARATAAKDDVIDTQHRVIQHDIMREIKNDPEYIKNGQRLFEITRLIELLGDRTTSICEWTIFTLQGKHIDLN